MLRVGACGGVGNRNLWGVRNPVKFNGAGQPVSVQTGQAPLPDSSGLLRLRPASFVASLGAISEYFGMYAPVRGPPGVPSQSSVWVNKARAPPRRCPPGSRWPGAYPLPVGRDARREP